MKFYYDVIDSYEIDIDFQDIYNYIKSNHPDYSNYSIYDYFVTNVEYILITIYKCYDFIEYDNTGTIDDMINYWEQWFNEKFGEHWDEI